MKNVARLGVIASVLIGCALLAAGLLWRSLSPEKLSDVEAAVRKSFPEVRQMSTGELSAELSDPKRPPVVLIDVRSKDEFDISHLQGARLVDPEIDPVFALSDVAPDAEVVVYCSVGWRSSKYARKLQSNQFKNVYNLEGSIFKWANEGRPVFNAVQKVQTVHPYDRVWGRLLLPQYRADKTTPEN